MRTKESGSWERTTKPRTNLYEQAAEDSASFLPAASTTDIEPKFTLENFSVKKSLSSLVGKTIESLETLGSVINGLFPKRPGNPADIYALRREVTDLKQKLHGEDAHAIPLDTRLKWVEKVYDRVVEVTYGGSYIWG